MGNRSAKFVSALVGSIIAGIPLAAVSQNAPAPSSTANAASDCLASPKATAPQGQHWYYRVERTTKRQCWYLRAEGGKDGSKTAQAATETPAADPAAPQQRSVQDARAEYRTSQSAAVPVVPAQTAAPAQQAAPPTADSDAQQPAIATRWPDAATTSPVPQAAPAPVTAAAAQPGAKPSKSPAPVALAAADSSDKPTGSIQMLLLVIGGALALAGLLASIIYRFAGGRARVQASDRRVNWDNVEPHDLDDGRAPWLNDTPAVAARTQQPRPIDFDAARPRTAQLAAFTNEISRIAAQSASTQVEAAETGETEIEEFDDALEIEAAAPQLAANDAHDDMPAAQGADAHDEDEDEDEDEVDEDEVDDTVNIDIITAMLERLAKDGPRLAQPSPEAGPANLAQNQRGQSAARA